MKMIKKIKVIVLVACILLSVPVVSFGSVADTSGVNGTITEGSYIYFDSTGWDNNMHIYCHVREIDGYSFYRWQSGNERCDKVKENLYSYDLSLLNNGTDIKDGFKEEKNYYVVFSNNTGSQTQALTIGLKCIGDTAYMTSNMVENPYSKDMSDYECVWKTNNKSFGPHFEITSSGSVIGQNFAPNESGVNVIGDWIKSYYLKFDKEEIIKILSNAMPKLSFNKFDYISEEIDYLKEKRCFYSYDLTDIEELLTKAFNLAYPSKISKTTAKIKAGGAVTLKVTNGTVKNWITSNKAVATVSKGKVTGLKKGSTTITAKLSTGKKLTCKVTVTTSPKLSKSSVSVKKGKTITVKITGKSSFVKNVYTNTKFAKIISNTKATSITVKGLKKGTTTLKIKVNGVVLKLKVNVK